MRARSPRSSHNSRYVPKPRTCSLCQNAPTAPAPTCCLRQAPKVLVRESSTLFRRVTGRGTGDDALLQADAQANAMEEGGAGVDEADTRLGDVELMPVAPGGSSADRGDGLAASPQSNDRRAS